MFRRWIEILCYAGLSIAVVALILPPMLNPLGRIWGTHAANMPLGLLHALAIVVGAGIIAGLAPLRTSRFRHLLNPRYPSWAWAVLIGVAGSMMVLHCTESQIEAGPSPGLSDWASLFFIMVASAGVGCFIVQGINIKAETPQKSLKDNPSLETPHERLMAWINSPESPITSESEDIFGFTSAIVHRMKKHLLYDPYCPCIGLIGPYGSGKTGILNLLTDELEKPTPQDSKDFSEGMRTEPRRIWVAKVGSWGQSSGSSAANQVLEAALDKLSKHVDCLSLSNLPRHYQEAMHASQNSWLGMLASYGGPDVNPENTLKRFDSILQASNAYLVLFIEDLDRNQPNPGMLSEIQSLLDRLKQSVGRIRFVVAIGGKAGHHFDFSKLCDRYEMLTTLPKETVKEVIKTTCIQLRSQYPSDFTWKSHNEERVLKAVANILSQPRHLRLALRYVSHAWRSLHGEVDMYELLLISALRAASPPAFEFLALHITDLRGYLGSEGQRKAHREFIRKLWNRAMKDVDYMERIYSKNIISLLFPGWNDKEDDGDGE